MDFEKEQILICDKYGSPYCKSDPNLIIGISLNVKENLRPINGLRHPVESGTTGWYIWAGEFSYDPDFFVPLHVRHLEEQCPIIIKYLGLAPGWRFLVSETYEDVWQDSALLNI